MDLVLLVVVGGAATLAVAGLTRRAVLGNRMDCSFEELKVGMRQTVWLEDEMILQAPAQSAVAITAVRQDPSPIANIEESPAELKPAIVRHVPPHARRAS
jgi:hypothetical protein